MGSQFLNLKYCGMDHSIQSLKISNATGSTDVVFLFLIFFLKEIYPEMGSQFYFSLRVCKTAIAFIFQVLSRTSLPQSSGYWVSTVEYQPWSDFPHVAIATQHEITIALLDCLWLLSFMARNEHVFSVIENMIWVTAFAMEWFLARCHRHAILSTATQKNSKFKWNLSADGLWSPALKTWNYNCVIGLLVNIELYDSYERTCVECTWVTAFAMGWFLARRQRLAVQLNENLKISL